MTKKQEAQEAHKIACLFELLGESIDKFAPESPMGIKIKKISLEILPFADAMLEEVYKVNNIRNSTYMINLTNKIDTVMRKNFENIADG